MMVLVSVETVGFSLLAFIAGMAVRPIVWWKRRNEVRERLFELCRPRD